MVAECLECFPRNHSIQGLSLTGDTLSYLPLVYLSTTICQIQAKMSKNKNYIVTWSCSPPSHVPEAYKKKHYVEAILSQTI